MVRQRLWQLTPRARGDRCLLLLQVELLQLLMYLFGVQVSSIDLRRWSDASAREYQVLYLLLLHLLVRVREACVLRRRRRNCHCLVVGWELFRLYLVKKVAILRLHSVDSSLSIDPDRVRAEPRTLLSIAARYQCRLTRVVAVLQEGLREQRRRVTACLLTGIAKVAQGVRHGHIMRVTGYG